MDNKGLKITIETKFGNTYTYESDSFIGAYGGDPMDDPDQHMIANLQFGHLCDKQFGYLLAGMMSGIYEKKQNFHETAAIIEFAVNLAVEQMKGQEMINGLGQLFEQFMNNMRKGNN